jgi:hypothetical protein
MSSKAFSVELLKTFHDLESKDSNSVTRVFGLGLAGPEEDLPF